MEKRLVHVTLPFEQLGGRARGVAAAVLVLALAAGACTGATPASTAPSAGAATPSLVATLATVQATPQPKSTPIPIWTGTEYRVSGAPGNCGDPGRPCEFTAAAYQTSGRWAFLPGLATYIPDGWKSTEQDAGEFNLLNPDFPDSGVYFWRDMIPVRPDGTLITDVPSTVAGITDWFTANKQLAVTVPVEVIIGKGLHTTTFVVDVADGVANMDPGCDEKPTKPACFPILTDPAHWQGGAWWVASTHRTRYYLATIGQETDRHLLLVVVVGSIMEPGPHVEANPAAELMRLEKAAAPILDNLDVSHVTFN